jgi:hypothetical protein
MSESLHNSVGRQEDYALDAVCNDWVHWGSLEKKCEPTLSDASVRANTYQPIWKIDRSTNQTAPRFYFRIARV